VGGKTFNLDQLSRIAESVPYSGAIFAIFVLAFAVKTPLFPFHGWLPETYYEASPTGTILLSALLSKAGIYGILRVGMELFPHLIKEWGPFLLGFAIAGVLYGGLAAWMQKDYKRLVAYSSFSHVNFILAGLFVWNQTAHSGAILQALNHGITITALFLMVAWLSERIGTTLIGPYQGLAKYLPKLCWLTLFFVLASVALPGTNNFAGELLILFGVFQVDRWMAVFLALTVILSALYMLRWMQKVYFEEASPFQASWIDIQSKDVFIVFPLIFMILWIGIYPSVVLKQTQLAAEKIDSINQRESQ
jgi:NADH-quinone oxidoreductase subunit M